MIQALQPTTNNGHLKGAVVIECKARERFYSPLRPPCSLYVLLEGRVSVARLTRDGKRLVTEVLEPGAVFGDLSFSGAGSDNEFAEAITDCQALAIDARRAMALVASDPHLAGRLLSAVVERLNAACDRLEELAYRPVEARIASAVLRIVGSDGRSALVSHQFLAEMAGTYRETATRALEALQLREMLQLGRCAIEVKDPQALTAVASDERERR